MGRPRLALIAFDRARTLEATSDEAVLGAARAHAALGRTEPALAAYAHLLEMLPAGDRRRSEVEDEQRAVRADRAVAELEAETTRGVGPRRPVPADATAQPQ